MPTWAQLRCQRRLCRTPGAVQRLLKRNTICPTHTRPQRKAHPANPRRREAQRRTLGKTTLRFKRICLSLAGSPWQLRRPGQIQPPSPPRLMPLHPHLCTGYQGGRCPKLSAWQRHLSTRLVPQCPSSPSLTKASLPRHSWHPTPGRTRFSQAWRLHQISRRTRCRTGLLHRQYRLPRGQTRPPPRHRTRPPAMLRNRLRPRPFPPTLLFRHQRRRHRWPQRPLSRRRWQAMSCNLRRSLDAATFPRTPFQPRQVRPDRYPRLRRTRAPRPAHRALRFQFASYRTKAPPAASTKTWARCAWTRLAQYPPRRLRPLPGRRRSRRGMRRFRWPSSRCCTPGSPNTPRPPWRGGAGPRS